VFSLVDFHTISRLLCCKKELFCSNLDQKIKAKHKKELASFFFVSLNAVNLTAHVDYQNEHQGSLHLFCFIDANIYI
jgi:hypothetical protein